MAGLDIEKYNQIPELIKQGNNALLSVLLVEMRSVMLGYMVRIFKIREEQAEEYVQFAMYQLARLGHRDSFKGAVYRMTFAIARNEFFSQYNRNKRISFAGSFDISHESNITFVDEPNQLKDLDLKETTGIIDKCMEKITPMNKRVVELYMEEPNIHYKEAAKRLNVSEANIRTLKSRAIKELKKHYDSYYKIPMVN